MAFIAKRYTPVRLLKRYQFKPWRQKRTKARPGTRADEHLRCPGMKVLECQNMDQTLKCQMKLPQLWSRQERDFWEERYLTEILKGSWKSDQHGCWAMLKNFHSHLYKLPSKLFWLQSLIPSTYCPRNTSQHSIKWWKWLLCKDQYQCVPWPFCIIPPKRKA